jgi:ApbE superfamily uncharacterized protein (UPF0280 family)
MNAQRSPLAGGRWHLQHGPIDIVIGAEGDASALGLAHEAAWWRFESVLVELVEELSLLRLPVRGECPVNGDIARRMWHACQPFAAAFITPMAAVAGAVAQELAPFYERPGIERAWINNGGDIALVLVPGASATVGLYADLARYAGPGTALATDARFTVHAAMPVRGIATSGWRGRSFSLGIADSVTVLARSAAEADAAATVIANAVNVDDPRVTRRPAHELRDDTDLGALQVTVDVPALPRHSIEHALRAGRECALGLQAQGLIHAAMLVCQGCFTSVDNAGAPLPPPAGMQALPVGSVFA